MEKIRTFLCVKINGKSLKKIIIVAISTIFVKKIFESNTSYAICELLENKTFVLKEMRKISQCTYLGRR